ncbi:MAG TPA: prolyl oligopeptidase family serine peptidase [Steroidobacteraceae bacterium]|jgi:dienelactone hydrolase|nr:prolyl oligopeptidase family serine peptidase [Steroidobacteraceae bacterium]
MLPSIRLSVLLLGALLLAACGGGDGMSGSGSNSGGTGSSGSGGATSTPAEGTLLESPAQLLSTVTAPSLLLELNVATNQQLLALSGAPVCDVLIYKVEYETVGAANEPTTASAALMVPSGLGSECTGKRPVVLYAHGTTTDRTFTMTDLSNAEALTLAAIFASQGYIVVAPNYAGYDTSTLTYHPYLVAEQQSKDMIDALTAARTALPLASATLTRDNGQLFITGYSQGGYVAMATQRAMEAAGLTVTAAAPMSGPYALAAFADAVFYGDVNGDATISTTLIIDAYQHAYGNIYTTPAQIFESQYASGIATLLPSTMTRGQIYSAGLLPEYALFSSTPPAAQYADITPPTTPASLAAVFALGFGSGNLIQNSYRLTYLEDAQANPDGGFPTVTTGLPAATPQLPWRQALQANDLRNWVPLAPVQLCGGDLDPLVFWLNTQLIQNYWAKKAPASASISIVDLESSGDPYASLKQGFELAKDAVAVAAVAQGATDGGAAAVDAAYHATLVAPFCVAATRSFFSNY